MDDVGSAQVTSAGDDVAPGAGLLNGVTAITSDQIAGQQAARVRLQAQYAHATRFQLQRLLKWV